MKSYEKYIVLYANQLEQIVAQHSGRPTEINPLFYWFSFDVMGHFAFSRSFGMLESQEWHYIVQLLRAGLALVGPFTPVPWLVRLAFDIPLLRIVRDFHSMTSWCTKQMNERIKVS